LYIVTGRKAKFNLVPKEAFLSQTGQYMGDFVALDLLEMFYAFAEIGFGAAGDPENMKNTEEVVYPLPISDVNGYVAWSASQHVG
jgi:hypothetical protein